MPIKSKTKRFFNLPLSEKTASYFTELARPRNVMPGRLMANMLELIAENAMGDNILDDDGESMRRLGDRKFREQFPARHKYNP